MGVMSCSCHNCTNILCTILIDNTYICNTCALDFKRYIGSGLFRRSDLHTAFNAFISSKVDDDDDVISVDKFLYGSGF